MRVGFVGPLTRVLSRRTVAGLILLLCVPTILARAAEPVAQTFNAPFDRVWSTTEAVLKQFDWDIDRQDRTIGWITTGSQLIEGEHYGVYEKGVRHRLTIQIRASGPSRTTVRVERTVFTRERILWMDNDEPVAVRDHAVEKSLLIAIGHSL